MCYCPFRRYDRTPSASPDLRDIISIQKPAEDAVNQLLPAPVAKEINGLIEPLLER
jgi:hypothetical protein